MATSLFAVALGAGGAAAQTPPGWSTAGDKPAKTTWQPYPASATGVTPLQPAAPAKSVDVAAPPPPIGSRVVLYNKPAGEVQPVQAVALPPLPKDVSARVSATKARADDKAKSDDKLLPPPANKEPEKSQVFRVTSDEELFREKTAGRDQTFAEEIAKFNVADEKKYQNDLAKFLAEPNRKESDRPVKPVPLRTDDFGVTLRAATAPPIMKPGYAPTQVKLEPGYVVHRRLFFEEKNSERYGWDLGMAQPFLSAAYFYKDVLLWPGHLMSNFGERFDTSAGKCPPGSPVPYLFYPPELTIRGGLWETAAVVGVVFLLP